MKARAPSSIPSRSTRCRTWSTASRRPRCRSASASCRRATWRSTSTRAPRTSRPTSRAATSRVAAAAPRRSPPRRWRSSEVAGSTPPRRPARRAGNRLPFGALARRAFLYSGVEGDAMKKLVYPFLLWALLAAAAQAQDAASLAQRLVERSGLAVQLQSTPKYFEEQIAALRGKVPDPFLLALAEPGREAYRPQAMAQDIAKTLAETMQPQEMERVIAWL